MNSPDHVLEEGKVPGDTTPRYNVQVDLPGKVDRGDPPDIFNLFVLHFTAYVSYNF